MEIVWVLLSVSFVSLQESSLFDAAVKAYGTGKYVDGHEEPSHITTSGPFRTLPLNIKNFLQRCIDDLHRQRIRTWHTGKVSPHTKLKSSLHRLIARVFRQSCHQ